MSCEESTKPDDFSIQDIDGIWTTGYGNDENVELSLIGNVLSLVKPEYHSIFENSYTCTLSDKSLYGETGFQHMEGSLYINWLIVIEMNNKNTFTVKVGQNRKGGSGDTGISWDDPFGPYKYERVNEQGLYTYNIRERNDGKHQAESVW